MSMAGGDRHRLSLVRGDITAVDADMIVFSRPRLSLRDFADELTATTGRQATIDSCANGGSILDGTDPGFGVMLER